MVCQPLQGESKPDFPKPDRSKKTNKLVLAALRGCRGNSTGKCCELGISDHVQSVTRCCVVMLRLQLKDKKKSLLQFSQSELSIPESRVINDTEQKQDVMCAHVNLDSFIIPTNISYKIPFNSKVCGDSLSSE